MAPLMDKFLPARSGTPDKARGSTTPTGDYSADEFEDDDEDAVSGAAKAPGGTGLTDKYIVSMDGPEDEALLGTSKFGGGGDQDQLDDTDLGAGGQDSFDEAFD